MGGPKFLYLLLDVRGLTKCEYETVSGFAALQVCCGKIDNFSCPLRTEAWLSAP